ncbi:hypothetical protein C2S52_017747 [Perilla frutescens var. hirtella]|nr:hypothetical protein C2S52_017747 [Perilla frutescens var. hirtella]KAH6811498.1 hypothetical protein C2S51_025260 [Perilla frutescens var. frutescens]
MGNAVRFRCSSNTVIIPKYQTACSFPDLNRKSLHRDNKVWLHSKHETISEPDFSFVTVGQLRLLLRSQSAISFVLVQWLDQNELSVLGMHQKWLDEEEPQQHGK